jgi:hypothetical protein
MLFTYMQSSRVQRSASPRQSVVHIREVDYFVLPRLGVWLHSRQWSSYQIKEDYQLHSVHSLLKSITFWVGVYWPRVEGWAFTCLLQMTFKESHIPGTPHSNNISQLGTELSKVLWVAGYRLWSRRLHMWRVHDGVAVAGGSRGGFPLKFLNIWIVFGVILGIFQSLICRLISKLAGILKELIPANFVLFYLNEGQNLLRVRWTNFHPWR